MMNHFYQSPFPTLVVDDNFFLREQTLEDTEAFFTYYSDVEVGQYILASKPSNLVDASAEIHYCRNMFYQQRGIYWTLARRDNNQMVGAIGLYINNQHRRAEVSYDLDKDYWHQGLMTRAVRTIIQHAFTQMEIIRVEALTVKENSASMRVLLKQGFTHEATLKNYRYFEGKPHDVEIFGLTPEMFAAKLCEK